MTQGVTTAQRLGAKIQRLRVALGVDQATLAAQSGVSQPTISRIESGSRSLKAAEALLIADALGVRVGALLGSPEQEDRVRGAARSADGAHPDQQLRSAALSYLELAAYLHPELPATRVLPKAASEAVGSAAAMALRAELNLGLAPIGDMALLLDQVGLDVLVVDAAEPVHGYTAWDPKVGIAVVAISQNQSAVRFRSSLAHELGHWWFRDEDLRDSTHAVADPEAELRATVFARHLLLPLAVAQQLPPADSLQEQEAHLNHLVMHYGVSPKIAAYQLMYSGHVNDAERIVLAEFTSPQLAAKYGWLATHMRWDQHVGAMHPPRRLLCAAAKAYQDGNLGAAELARWAGMGVSAVTDQYGVAGAGAPKPPETHLLDDDFSDLL